MIPVRRGRKLIVGGEERDKNIRNEIRECKHGKHESQAPQNLAKRESLIIDDQHPGYLKLWSPTLHVVPLFFSPCVPVLKGSAEEA